MKISFSDDFKYSENGKMQLEKRIQELVARISKENEFDIGGLVEINIVNNISPIHEDSYLSKISGETVSADDQSKHVIKIVGDVFYKPEKEVLSAFIHTLCHEMAHIHDHNKIPHIYMYGEELSQESVFFMLARRVWSEFIATRSSIRYNNNYDAASKIETLVSMFTKSDCENTNKVFECIMGCSSYILGDIIDRDDFTNKMQAIDNELCRAYMNVLYEELLSLLEIYPNWDNIYILDNLRNIMENLYAELENRK